MNDTPLGESKRLKQDTLIQSAVLYQIVIIGEAVGDLSVNLRQQYSDVTWSQIIGMRNILAHQYFQVNFEIVWTVVEHYLPDLKVKIEMILQGLGDEV